jgi:ESS family glutamate:Na+ symporter
MNFNYIIHIGIISLNLLLAALIRARVKFFQRYLIPSPIIAGFFLLIFYNFVAPVLKLRSDYLGELVYHLLNISFIAMMLRVSDKTAITKQRRRTLFGNITAVIAQYALQCFFGLLAAFVLVATIRKDLSLAIGYTLPLGFELGPGQAYSMSLPWEKMGFEGASSVGLTMAAIGFLLGSFGGVYLINLGLRRGWISEEYRNKITKQSVRTGFFSRKESERPVGSFLSTDGESLDTFSYHIALVMLTYFLSFLFLSGLSSLLHLIGPMGEDLAESLWGINFIFSAFCALFVKLIMKQTKVETTIDNGSLNRINGLSVDLTVAASLGAISLVAVQGYWLPILVLVAIGAVITLLILPYYCSRLYDDHQFFRMLVIYGTATGTLPTGLSLLRVVDPEFETPVATDYMYSVGIVFILVIPIILTINLPILSVRNQNPQLFWLAVLIIFGYLVLSFVAYLIISGKRAFANRSKLFYVE